MASIGTLRAPISTVLTCTHTHTIEPLVAPAPASTCEVCVVVPVRDEAARIEATLRALTNQVDLRGRPFAHERYEVVLLANNCGDESAEIAYRFARRHPTFALHVVERTLPPSDANIGHARRLLMDEAHRRLMLLGCRRGVIASTDGDTLVAPTWLAATLAEIARGADAVGGRIIVDSATLERGPLAYHLRNVGYWLLAAAYESYLDPDPCDPWPRHFQHFGASLAVTNAAYARVGGMPAVPGREDMALVQMLRRHDARIRHSPAVRVTTSGRRDARTTMGLAAQLGEWTAMERTRQPALVESVPALERRVRARRELRALRHRVQAECGVRERDVASLAEALGIDRAWLWDAVMRPTPMGLFIEEVARRQAEEGIWTQELVEVGAAIEQLRRRLRRMDKERGRECVISGRLTVQSGPGRGLAEG